MYGTGIAYAAFCLRAIYATPGTDIAHAATYCAMCGTGVAYAATGCAMCSTGIVYATTGCAMCGPEIADGATRRGRVR
eukprot:3941627-Rhodomonas_salina.1